MYHDMADNSIIAKWTAYVSEEEASEGAQSSIQFFKDGSCVVPLKALGSEEESASYLFFQVFENGTIRFEPGPGIYRYVIDGDRLSILWLDGSKEFVFAKEGKKIGVKAKAATVIQKSEKEEIEREPEEYEWKCPKCGKINQNYVGTCGCGEGKPKDKPAFNWVEVHPELKKPDPVPEPEETVEEEVVEKPKKDAPPEREPEEYEWKCPKCGKINQNYVGTCGCGEGKPKDKPAFNWAEVHPELKKTEPETVSEPEPEEEIVEKPKKDAPPEREPEENEWKCPGCGKINQNYVGTCGCGEGKPKVIPVPAKPEE